MDFLSFRDRLIWKEKFLGRWAEAAVTAGPAPGAAGTPPAAGRQVHLLLPLTYMNRSGDSAARLAAFYRIAPEETLAVHDEIERAFGEVSLAFGGGLAGHQGLKSLAQRLGTRDFWRFRLGVSRPGRGTVASHVLGRFSPDEEAVLPRYLEAAARMLEKSLEMELDPQRPQRVKLLEDA